MNFNNPHHKFSNFLVSRFLYILKNNESPKVLLFLQITPIAFSILEIKTEKFKAQERRSTCSLSHMAMVSLYQTSSGKLLCEA